jgi:hypothetical protein
MRNTARHLDASHAAILLLLFTIPLVPCAGDSQERDRAEVLERALQYSPEYTVPVLRSAGTPEAIYTDLNANGTLDVAVLTIVADPRVEPTTTQLSNPLRLYNPDVVHPVFILEAYFSGQEAIVTVELGRRALWNSMGFRRLTTEPFPVAIEIGFRSLAGSRTDLVVFHEGGKVSRFSFEESRNQRGFIIDVDDDGSDDIITAHRVPEAGRGFETFLELHKLQSEGYRRVGSVPIVRTVNDFLTAAARDMERGDWEALSARIADGTGASDLERAFRGITDEDIAESRFDHSALGKTIDRAAFPHLTDNPFPAPYTGRSFRLVFRVECCDHDVRFFEAIIGLSNNPFTGTRVAFLTEHGGGR